MSDSDKEKNDYYLSVNRSLRIVVQCLRVK